MTSTEQKSIKIDPENWVDNYGDYLYAYALSRVSSPELAQDFVQDTFLSALKSIESFKGKSDIKTWLTSILKNKIIDHYRKEAKKAQTNLTDKSNQNSMFRQEEPFKGHWKEEAKPGILEFNPDKAFETDEFQKILEWCMSFLPKKWAIVFAMKMIEEYKTEEICKETGISSSNFWVMMHRARLKMRDCIKKNWVDN